MYGKIKDHSKEQKERLDLQGNNNAGCNKKVLDVSLFTDS